MTPQPDLVFILDAEPEVIAARKQELTKEEIARQLAEYHALQAARPDKFLRLDANLPPRDNARQATAEIATRMYRQF